MDQYLGEIRMFAGNYAPQDWALCDGRLLNVTDNAALFSLLGTTYGGDGTTTFALPDLRGRLPLHQGTSAGGTTYAAGQQGGAELITLTTQQLPSHTHALTANGSPGELNAPANNFWASGSPYSNLSPNAQMDSTIVEATGGSQPHENMMPYQVVSFIIALQGEYPQNS